MLTTLLELAEKRYDELFTYSQDSNYGNFDVDIQYTKDRLEEILQKDNITDDDIKELKMLLCMEDDTDGK